MSFVAKLAREIASTAGIRSDEATPIALAACIATHLRIASATLDEALLTLAHKVKPRNDADAMVRVRSWLLDIDLSETQRRGLQAYFPINLPAAIDWTAELEALVDEARYREPFIPISPKIGAAIGSALNIPYGTTIACVHAGSATIAWGLAKDRPVTLHVTNWLIEMVMALLAYVDGRPLLVDRRNPIETVPYSDGSFTFSDHHSPEAGIYDYLISVPPLGFRMKDGNAAGLLFEAWQVEQLACRARRVFISLITDGLLFRESRNDAAFREGLCAKGGLTVTSLPPGIFGRASGVQVNLLTVDQTGPSEVTFVDGRTMARISRSGREQEELIAKQLESAESGPSRKVGLKELEASNFNLLPSRYVLSDELALMDDALSNRQVVRLGDVAKILRPRAPQPVRDEPSSEDILALEIAVSDLTDGKVKWPSKEVRFPARERVSVEKVGVEIDDILISIKGNVGLIGIVPVDAILGGQMTTPPLTVSQSLAIIRLVLGAAIHRPSVLAGILSSPPMRAKLQALAGGTTVPSLPISALQDLPIPVPGVDEQLELQGGLEALDSMQQDIETRIANRDATKDALWRKFWGTPSDQEEA